MFDQTFVNTRAQTRKPWTVAGSLALQTGLVAVLLILPLLHPEIPKLKLEAPPRPYVKLTTEQPPPEPKTIQHATRSRAFTVPLTAPRNIPTHVMSLVEDAPSITNYAIAGAFASADPGTGTGLFAGLPAVPVKPPAPVVRPEPPAPPIRISIGVNVAKLIFAPKPQYSALAKAARVQGTVKLQAVIAVDGSIQNLRVMSGSPLLANAALEAVRQWRYQPTLLSGKPVEVVTEIDVVFTLSQ